MPSGGIVMDRNTLKTGVQKFRRDLISAVGAATAYEAQRGQDWMRANAPWTDRTSNARNGLFATSSTMPNGWRITMYHTMPYGVFLELSRDGRFQIIVPAIRHTGDELMKVLRNIMERAS